VTKPRNHSGILEDPPTTSYILPSYAPRGIDSSANSYPLAPSLPPPPPPAGVLCTSTLCTGHD